MNLVVLFCTLLYIGSTTANTVSVRTATIVGTRGGNVTQKIECVNCQFVGDDIQGDQGSDIALKFTVEWKKESKDSEDDYEIKYDNVIAYTWTHLNTESAAIDQFLLKTPFQSTNSSTTLLGVSVGNRIKFALFLKGGKTLDWPTHNGKRFDMRMGFKNAASTFSHFTINVLDYTPPSTTKAPDNEVLNGAHRDVMRWPFVVLVVCAGLLLK